ncbi:MAG: helix-turn-helix transcriptional regulator [Acidobacteriota bacterium]
MGQRPTDPPKSGTEGTAEARGAGEAHPEPSHFEGIGKALRRLRVHRGFKQFEMAREAGITKAMLSAYETSKRRPSLNTLSQLLDALGADLADLHRALLAEQRDHHLLSGTRSDLGPSTAYPRHLPARGVAEGTDVYRVLGVQAPLPPAEELAMTEMLGGFHKLLRYLHLQQAKRAAEGDRRRNRESF